MNKRTYIALIFFFIALLFFLVPNKQKPSYIKNEGKIHGTFYNIIYQHPEGKDLQAKIEEQMRIFELSLSTFNEHSVISKINRNEEVQTDSFFEAMFHEAKKISEQTGGAFDITVAPLVNAWGFGFKQSAFPDKHMVDSLLQFIGYEKITLENHRIIKSDPQVMLDASAIAKGYSVDIIAELLRQQGCEDFLVDIGGEIVCKGKNQQGEKWSIGINKPTESPIQTGELQLVLQLSNTAMATSGNYRQFYYRDGKKFAHTIHPATGYPVEHNLLSATIIAPTCMQADALATACMVLGTEKSLELCRQNDSIEGYFIYSEGDSLKTVETTGFKEFIK